MKHIFDNGPPWRLGDGQEVGGGCKGVVGNVAVGPGKGTPQGPDPGPEHSDKPPGFTLHKTGRHSELYIKVRPNGPWDWVTADGVAGQGGAAGWRVHQSFLIRRRQH